MIGTNPLVDALLLQSLKSGVAPASDKGTPNVSSTQGSQGTREVKADSKLNDRPYHPPVNHGGYGQFRGYAPSASTIITLNHTAQFIADIMAKYPVVETSLLILPMAESQIGKPGILSGQLHRLVSFSGLFYESHLASWFRGEYPESLLRLEPQFNAFKGSDQRQQVFADPPGLSLNGPEERMKYMIRHQLEVLDSPTLRFTGNLVPGLPVQLWLQHVILPAAMDEKGELIKSERKKAFGWRVLVRLEHEAFDYVDIAIALVDEDLSVRLTGNHAMLQEYFRRDFEELNRALGNLGIEHTHFSRQLMSRLEVRPDFRLNITSGSHMQTSKSLSGLEQEYGVQAEHVFYKAKSKGMTAHQDHEMLGLLMNLETDKMIPDILYSIIEILTYWTMSQIEYLSE
jgi:hypothetical protein